MLKTGGILKTRHNVVNETVELLVFGYQSKLYRDDAKAQEFDRESHLIPTPYDSNLTISRYDVRATLDIAPQENDNMYLNRLECLSQAEQQAEAMAEKERYYSLYINEVEEEIHQEEQLKRQSTEYNQIPFNYDEIGPKESAAVPEEAEDVDMTPFESPLELPPDMESPNTLKQHQIIEKTAKFISSQGPQMEILLKTKQAANSQFNFLSHDGQYNAYYKHVLNLIKAGTYQYFENGDSNKNEEEAKKEENGHIEEPQPSTSEIVIPKLAFVPSADCAYTQLISKITKAPISAIEQQRKLQVANTGNGNSGIKSLGLLANYCSDSDDSIDDNEENSSFVGSVPSAEIQIVIDKTAMYVAKNGREFEETLKKKNDSRFQFLNPEDELHAYYTFKVNESKKSLLSSKPTPTVVTTTRVEIKKPGGENAVVETTKSKIPPAPVSFSIKPKEEKSQLISKPFDDRAENSKKSQSPKNISVEEELEMQVDVMKAERAERLAKEKLKGKIFTAARKNLIPKEKILQIERKKKALMFVNQIKGSNSSGGGNVNNTNNEVINLTACNDDSDDSVKSIPMSSSSKKKHSRSRSRKRSTRSSSSSRSRSSRSRSSYSSDKSRSRRKHKKTKSHRNKRSKHRRKSSRSRSRSRSYSSRRVSDRRDRRH